MTALSLPSEEFVEWVEELKHLNEIQIGFGKTETLLQMGRTSVEGGIARDAYWKHRLLGLKKFEGEILNLKRLRALFETSELILIWKDSTNG